MKKVAVGIWLVALVIGCAIGMMFLWNPIVSQTTPFTHYFNGGTFTVEGDSITVEAEALGIFDLVGPGQPIHAVEEEGTPDWYSTKRFIVVTTPMAAGEWHVESDGGNGATVHITSPNPVKVTYHLTALGWLVAITVFVGIVVIFFLWVGIDYIRD